MIELLNEHDAKVGMTDTMLATKLCTLIKYQQIELLTGWLSCGVNVNVRDYDERTPLMIACASSNIDIVEMLLKHGADPNATNRFNNNVLKYAEQSSKKGRCYPSFGKVSIREELKGLTSLNNIFYENIIVIYNNSVVLVLICVPGWVARRI